MVETPGWFQDEVILHRASHLQLLGVMPIAVDGPHADRPHQQHADNRHQRQHRAQVAHHRQRDGADDPVGAQAVIQFDLRPAAICQLVKRLKISPGARLLKKLSEFSSRRENRRRRATTRNF